MARLKPGRYVSTGPKPSLASLKGEIRCKVDQLLKEAEERRREAENAILELRRIRTSKHASVSQT